MNKWVEKLRAEENKEQIKSQDPNLEFHKLLQAGSQQEPPTKITAFPGLVVRLYRTRPDCLAAGFCKQITHENCDLYPVTKAGKLTGFCRKRTPGG